MADLAFFLWAADILGQSVIWVVEEFAAGSYLVWQLFWQWAYGG